MCHITAREIMLVSTQVYLIPGYVFILPLAQGQAGADPAPALAFPACQLQET